MAERNPLSMAEAIQEWQQTPFGFKKLTVQKWCSSLGISHGTFHKEAKRITAENRKKKRRDAGQRENPNLIEWCRAVVRVMGFVPKTTRKPPIKLAVKKALLNGILPGEAADIPVETFYRVIREEGLLEREKRIVRFEAGKPMDLWQMDASGSEYIYVARMEGTTPILKLRATKTNYKNKPQDGMKVWYYGAVDDHSGYWLAKAVIAPGESSADNLNFFRWCACKKDDKRIPFYGLPEMVYMDNGPLARAAATKEFFKRIEVELKTHEPNSPEDTGKIEVRWKSLWRMFEMDMLMDPHWNKQEFTADELNAWLLNFIVEQNLKEHRHLQCSRLDAWLTVIKNGGVVEISPDAWDTVFTTKKVLVDGAGWFSFNGQSYEVKGIQNKYVRAYKGVINNKVIVKDLQTNYIYEVREARYIEVGEYRADKKQEWDRLKKESLEMKELFTPGAFKRVYGEKADTNVAYLPVRAAERAVETSFEKVDPFGAVDQEKNIPIESDAMKIDRGIVPSRMSIMEFFRKLIQAVGPITPELNQQLRAEYGDSIEILKAEEVILKYSQESGVRGTHPVDGSQEKKAVAG